jgi:hypothetical protein
MKRYFKIVSGCAIACVGGIIAAMCVSTLNALFGGSMSAARFLRFEVTVNNAWLFALPIIGFALALIYVGASMALDWDGKDG